MTIDSSKHTAVVALSQIPNTLRKIAEKHNGIDKQTIYLLATHMDDILTELGLRK